MADIVCEASEDLTVISDENDGFHTGKRMGFILKPMDFTAQDSSWKKRAGRKGC